METHPEGAVLPPVVTNEQDLPFNHLSWPNFERLCLRLARLDSDIEDCRPYGTPGQYQAGIDLLARRRSNDRYRVYQCKRVENFTPAKIVAAVKSFEEGGWHERATEFVLCTTISLVRTEQAEELETQRDHLRRNRSGVARRMATVAEA
jgi:hypothetical protein